MITPEFFDRFGIVVFSYIIIFSLVALYKKKSVPKWAYVVLLLIGIAGLLIDGAIVLFFKRVA